MPRAARGLDVGRAATLGRGPSRTTVTPAVAERLQALVTLDALQPGEYLFHTVTDRCAAHGRPAWTRYIQSVFKAYSGVALSPKECRASFVTRMRDGDHDDETRRGAERRCATRAPWPTARTTTSTAPTASWRQRCGRPTPLRAATWCEWERL